MKRNDMSKQLCNYNHYFHEFKKLLLCERLNIGGQFEANVLANKINRTMNLIEK